MIQEKVLLCSIPLEHLEERFKQIIKNELLNTEVNKLQERLLSPEETRKLFSPAVSKVTLHHWAKKGKLKQYRIGARVFYKYSEIIESLVHIKKYGINR